MFKFFKLLSFYRTEMLRSFDSKGIHTYLVQDLVSMLSAIFKAGQNKYLAIFRLFLLFSIIFICFFDFFLLKKMQRVCVLLANTFFRKNRKIYQKFMKKGKNELKNSKIGYP